MAKIVKTDKQEAALKVIKGNIKVLAGINIIINSREKDFRISIIAGKRKVSFVVGKSFCDSILKEISKKMIAQTEILAIKNAIKLNEEEMAVLKNREDSSNLSLNEEE